MDASVAPPMDRSDIVCEQNRSPAEGEGGYPNSQELFSGSERRTDCETGSSGDENSLFQAEETCAPTRTGRLQRSKGQTLSSLSPINVIPDNSSDLSQGIEEYLKNPFGKWGEQKKKKIKKKKTKKKRYLVTSKRSWRAMKRKPRYSIPMEERGRRLLDQGIQFPFTPLKYLPLKQYFPYEQFVLGGFLNHIKNLKYERSLKESLKDMNVDEDLENEDFQMRKYSYMDEDGPLSPISESGENNNEDEGEEEVQIVENSTFILDCQVPSKKNWHIAKKGKK